MAALPKDLQERLRAAAKAKADRTILRRCDLGRFLVALDAAKVRAEELADQSWTVQSWNFGTCWRMYSTKKFADQITHGRLQHTSAGQLAALAANLPFEWVTISSYVPGNGAFRRPVRVYPIRPLLGLLDFLELPKKKYLIAYSDSYVRACRKHESAVAEYGDRNREPEPLK